MGKLGQDLRFAVRVLGKSRWVSGVAVLALALGIGGNAAIFSVVNSLLLRPLPFPRSEQLVEVMRTFRQGATPFASVPQYFYWKSNSRTVSAMAAYDSIGSGFNLSGQGHPERLAGSKVTAEFFTVLATPPALGRDFLPQDDLPGAQPTVILSHGLWQRRFGGDKSLISQPIILNNKAHLVIGVAPPGFRYPANAELWTPFQFDPADQSAANYIYIGARLKDESSLQEAQAELAVLGRQFFDAHPDWANSTDESVSAEPFQEFLYGDLRPSLLILLASVGLVLLIACANVANLQLARSASRQKEIAIRTALGARSRRIVRQLLTESVLLALAGGGLGILLCALSLGPLMSLSPLPVPPLEEVGLDVWVLLFTLAISLLTGILFGLAPAFQAWRIDFNDALQESSLRSTGGVKGRRVRMALVVAEVSLAVVLMIGASLLLRSFMTLRSVDPGFDPSGVLTMKLSLSSERYSNGEAFERLSDQLLPKLDGLAGVEQAGIAMPLPMEVTADLTFTIEGRYEPGTQNGVGNAYYNPVAGNYFEALRIPLLQGRRFDRSDRSGAPLVALINQSAAKRFWPDESPLGKRIQVGMPMTPDLADPQPRTIVGVAGDVRIDGLDQPPSPIVYVPLSQTPDAVCALLTQFLPLSLALRSETASASLAQTAQQQVWSVDPHQPVTQIRPLQDIVAGSLGAREFNMALLGILAVMALLLAAVGIYGVLSYLVSQRTREIGIRMALGAGHGQILGLVVFQWMKAALFGIALGLAGAVAATRLVAGLFRGIAATDLLTFFTVPALFLLVALAASYLPARRAARLNPTCALRWE